MPGQVTGQKGNYINYKSGSQKDRTSVNSLTQSQFLSFEKGRHIAESGLNGRACAYACNKFKQQNFMVSGGKSKKNIAGCDDNQSKCTHLLGAKAVRHGASRNLKECMGQKNSCCKKTGSAQSNSEYLYQYW